jgi:hypothetical protein
MAFIELMTDQEAAGPGLAPADVAVMDFAAQLAADATSVSAEDVAVLREAGLTDDAILDVALTGRARAPCPPGSAPGRTAGPGGPRPR